MNAGSSVGTVCRENDSGGGVRRGACHKGKARFRRNQSKFQVIPHSKFQEETREIVQRYSKLAKYSMWDSKKLLRPAHVVEELLTANRREYEVLFFLFQLHCSYLGAHESYVIGRDSEQNHVQIHQVKDVDSGFCICSLRLIGSTN